MKNFLKLLTLKFIFFTLCESILVAVPDYNLGHCKPHDKNDIVFNISNLHVIQTTDTDTFANGTVVYNKAITSPWRMEVNLYKYDRGEWLLNLKKTFADVCGELHNPASVLYYLTKHSPPCPIAAGAIATLNMVDTKPPKWFMAPIPGTYAGRYRIEFINESSDGVKINKECILITTDVHDID